MSLLKDSIWNIDHKRTYPELKSDIEVEAAVIGGGITGLTAAYYLNRLGLTTAVLEKNSIGSMATGHTSGHLSTFIDGGYGAILKKFGKEKAKLSAQAMAKAIDIIEKISGYNNIDCDFRRIKGYYYANDTEGNRKIENEFKALKELDLNPIKKEFADLPFDTQKAIEFDGNAAFHPVKYISSLAQIINENGAEIFENTNAGHIEGDGPYVLKAGDYQVTADYIIMATHTPVAVNPVQTEVAPYKSYVTAVKIKEDIPDALFWNTDDPYIYIRKYLPEDKIIIIGGKDHKTAEGNEKEAIKKIIDYARNHFTIEEVIHSWSAQYFVPSDSLPLIGKAPGSKENVYIATGFNGDGLIFGSLGAYILTDLIKNNDNEFKDLFDPSRLPLKGIKEFISENADVMKRFIADRLKSGTNENFDDMPDNHGKVITAKGKVIAVYKDNNGKIKTLSAKCTHLGCIVHWNDSTKTWDCPCHGGRYYSDGYPMEGPPHHKLDNEDI